jgi:hypothetical protein
MDKENPQHLRTGLEPECTEVQITENSRNKPESARLAPSVLSLPTVDVECKVTLGDYAMQAGEPGS